MAAYMSMCKTIKGGISP
jgi:hypothetical protein